MVKKHFSMVGNSFRFPPSTEQWIIMVNFSKNQKVNTSVFIHSKLKTIVIETSIYFEKLKGYVLVAVIQ